MLNLNLKSRIYFTLATKDGDVCDDDGVEAGTQAPASFYLSKGFLCYQQHLRIIPSFARSERFFMVGR
jgi:hypothetical protein